MRKAAEKRMRVQYSNLSPNKEFLLKFLSRNFGRESLNQQYIRSFNFYLSEQSSRIHKDFTTHFSEIQVGIMLLSSLMSNLEQLSNDIAIFSSLNDTFYLMLGFVHKCLIAFTNEKSPKPEAWILTDRMLDLFQILNKSPSTIPEPNRDEHSDKRIVGLNWIEEIPDFTRASKGVMGEKAKLVGMTQLLLATNNSERFIYLVRSSFRCYLQSNFDQLNSIILKMLESSIAHKKFTAIKKSLHLMVKLQHIHMDVKPDSSVVVNINGSVGGELLTLFNKILQQDSKGKSIKQYKEVIDALEVQKFLSPIQVFNLTNDIFKDILQLIQTTPFRELNSFIETFNELSFIFSEISSEVQRPNNKGSLYEIIIRMLRLSSQKGDTEEDKQSAIKSICKNLQAIFTHTLNNTFTRETIMMYQPSEFSRFSLLLCSETDHNIQKFILKTLPHLIGYLPQLSPTETNNFILAIHLKLVISFINKNPQTGHKQLFEKYYTISQKKESKITNYDFAVYFCFLGTMEYSAIEKNGIFDLLFDSIIKRLSDHESKPLFQIGLIADLALFIIYVNKSRYAILKVSVKEFTDTMFNNIDLLSQSLILPNIQINQTALFAPHETARLDERVLHLNRLLRERKHLFDDQKYSEKFYQMLFEINSLSEKYLKETGQEPNPCVEIQTMRKMKLLGDSNDLVAVSGTLGEFTADSKIEIFYSLVKIYRIVEQGTDDSESFPDLQKRLFSLLSNAHKASPLTDEDIVKLYQTRVQKRYGNMDILNEFIAYNKDQEITKFYSSAKLKLDKLDTLIIQTALRILINIYSPEPVLDLTTPEFKRIHLLYLPIKSPYFKNLEFENEFQLIFIEMYLVSLDKELVSEIKGAIKEHLLKEFNKIIDFYSSTSSELRDTIKFNDFDFLSYLLSQFLIEYEPGKQKQQDSFIYTMLSILSSDPQVLHHLRSHIHNTPYLSHRVTLLSQRIKTQIISKKFSNQNSKRIYSIIQRLSGENKLLNLNQHIKLILELDDVHNSQLSIYICRELSLMKNFVEPNEDMVNLLFEYIAKMYEFYERFTGDEGLLVVVPQMICEIFGINEKSSSEISVGMLNEMERNEKPNSCTRFGGSSTSSYYRCVECQSKLDKRNMEEKKVICHCCIVNCHEGHAYYSVPSNNRTFCLCLLNGSCKFKKNNLSDYKKKDIGMMGVGRPIRELGRLGGDSRQFHDFKEVREMKEIRDVLKDNLLPPGGYSKMRGVYDPNVPMLNNPMGNPLGNPLSFFSSYGDDLEESPFNRRQAERYYDRYDKFSYRDRELSENWDEDFGDEGIGSNLFKAMIPKRRKELMGNNGLQRGQSKFDIKIEAGRDFQEMRGGVEESGEKAGEVAESQIVEEQGSDCFEDEKPVVKMEEETSSVISHQSYLLHIFLGIVEERFSKQNRKISHHETPLWRLPSQPPVLAKLSEKSLRIYTTNFKNKMNFDNNNGMRASPMIVRKPIAISDKVILVLCSLSIFVFEAKKFLSYMCNASNAPNSLPEALYRHDLLIQAHSVEFVPGNPNLLCVSGLKVMQILSINNQNTISKSPLNTYQNNGGDVINKVQALEIGVLVSDARSIKLIDLHSKTVLIMIPAPKEGGVIRDWFAVREQGLQPNQNSYNLLVITSYGSIFEVLFDENDRGEKPLNKKLNGYNKKKDETGVSIYQSYLHDGRKIMMAGIKDSQSNLFALIQKQTVESSVIHKFNTLFSGPSLFGHIQLIESNSERILFACTLKDGTNREMSIHSGPLYLVSLTRAEKLEIQVMQYHADNIKCEGMFVWNLDKDIKMIISLTEDGAVYMHSVGKLLKENIVKYMAKTEDKPVLKEESKDIDDIKKVIFSEINLESISKVQLCPIVDFFDKSEQLKKGIDYSCEQTGDEYAVNLTQNSKLITGISLSSSAKVILPTRTIPSALEVGFSSVQCLYYYVHGLKLKIERTPTSYERENGYESMGEKPKAEFQLSIYGQSANNSNKIKKIQTLISKLSNEGSNLHGVDIFKILAVFLKEIKETQNYIIEDSQLKVVIESFKNLLAQVNEEYYHHLRTVTILSIEIYNAMMGETSVRADNPLHPYSSVAEIIIKQLDSLNISKTNIFLADLIELLDSHPQVFFYLISKYHKLLQRLYKKYTSFFSKDQDSKDKYLLISTVQIPEYVVSLLKIFIASLNLKRKPAQRDQVLLLIKNVFAKYSASKTIRSCIYHCLVKYYSVIPEEWIKEVKSVEQESIIEPLIDPQFKNILGGIDKYDQYLSEEQYSQMDEDLRYKFAIMFERGLDIEEEKMDFEDENEMKVVEQEQNETEKTNIANEIFTYCMRPLDNEDSYETGYDFILMAEVCFKATEKVDTQAVEHYLAYICKFLKKLNLDKPVPPITIAYLALFSDIILKSTYLANNPSTIYNEIKDTVLQLVDDYVFKQSSIRTKTSIKLAQVKRLCPIQVQKINIPHSLLYLLRKPIDPTPSILLVKFYPLLSENREQYKEERDKIIFEKNMRHGDIEHVYKKAKKSPESWRKSADPQWLESMIEEKKEGWEQALELLSIYYDQ